MLKVQLVQLSALFTISGAAALIYQVLWTRELGLLFGSTAQAAALTIAIFFTGIAIGAWLCARWAGAMQRPLRLFGLVEIGVAATALGHFFVADAYVALYPTLIAAVDGMVVLETVLKAVVAATILLPSAILMGATLPLMGQHLISAPEQLGRMGSALYALNTIGGAVGALAAGFFLPVWLGFYGAYLLAVALDLLVGLTTLFLARRVLPQDNQTPLRGGDKPDSRLWLIAFGSGFATLAVEVIWVRAFAQVLQNSVYTYALVLAVFLGALALGAALANTLTRLVFKPEMVLRVLLMTSAALVAATPYIFYTTTNGLGYLGGQSDFVGYVVEVSRVAALTILVPGAILGAVLPYLLRLMQGHSQPGATLGRLIALNTLGAIFGTLVGGFILLPTLGAWKSLWLLAAVYLLMVPLVRQAQGRMPTKLSGLVAIAGAVFLLIGAPGIQSTRLADGESLLAFSEGHSAHVAVVQQDQAKYIRVNNFYTLGGSGALIPERNQTMIALLTHPDPQELFFLGLGTGISAGAGLFANPQRLTVCELLPDVIAFARDWFVPYVNGLFEDERVTIYPEDGRQCLARSRDAYDMIIADLFTPWRAGVSSTYSLEHYRLAARRLKPGGAYVQWLPLYQVSQAEFEIIGNTMAQVFPSLTLWRGDLYPETSIVALIGRNDFEPLEPQVLADQWRAMTGSHEPDHVLIDQALKFYVGNGHSGLFAAAPINTDSRPIIEYLAPRTQRAVVAGRASWLVGRERDRFYEDLYHAMPPNNDPYLARLTSEQLDMVRAGLTYSQWQGLRFRREMGASQAWRRFITLAPPHARNPSSPAGQVAHSETVFGDQVQ